MGPQKERLGAPSALLFRILVGIALYTSLAFGRFSLVSPSSFNAFALGAFPFRMVL